MRNAPGQSRAHRPHNSKRPRTALYATFALALTLMATLPGIASNVLMENTFDNTVRIEASDGTLTLIYFNADGTYSTSKNEKGTWTVTGSTLCTETKGREPICNNISKRQVGDIWSETDPEGNPITISIVAGR